MDILSGINIAVAAAIPLVAALTLFDKSIKIINNLNISISLWTSYTAT